jgi:hypothetical protein
LIAGVLEDYTAHTGREAADDFPYWEPCHRALLGNGIVGSRTSAARSTSSPASA